jgi:2'-5' RNA ligase
MDEIFESMMHLTTRFVIISVLPEPVRSEIRSLTEELSLLSESVTAMSYPPHITLRTGSVVPQNMIAKYIDGFRNVISRFKEKGSVKRPARTLELEFIRYKENGLTKNMIAYTVEKSAWLADLNMILLEYKDFIKSDKTDFYPHISLAYEDLDDVNFMKLKKHIYSNKNLFFRNFSFDLDNISLYHRNDNGNWQEYFSEKI